MTVEFFVVLKSQDSWFQSNLIGGEGGAENEGSMIVTEEGDQDFVTPPYYSLNDSASI